ncbi:MAG: bifunctional DNA primase/polymerase [Candidatus Heimdallarchaeota archaeon]
MDNTGFIKIYKDLKLNVVPCDSLKKKPIGDWKEYQFKKYQGTIAKDSGLAVICGKSSNNLFVFDFDFPEAIKIIDKFELKKKTLVVLTGGGGYHVYCRFNDRLPNTLRMNSNDNTKHVDVQSQGTIVVVPPSMHESGKEYKIISDVLEVSEVNVSGILEELEKLGFNPEEKKKPMSDVEKGVHEGERNNSGFRYVMYLRRRYGLDKIAVLLEMEKWNRLNFPPLSNLELRALIASAFTYEIEEETQKKWQKYSKGVGLTIKFDDNFWTDLYNYCREQDVDLEDVNLYCKNCHTPVEKNVSDDEHKTHLIEITVK